METETVQRRTFGLAVSPSEYRPARDVIAVEERTASGNMPLRLGRENEFRQGWSQIGYVVLTPDEADEMAAALGSERDRYAVLAEAWKVLETLAREHWDAVLASSGPEALRHGVAYSGCKHGADGIFDALNVLANFRDDERAAAAIDGHRHRV